MKKCNKCLVEKALTDYYKDKNRVDGRAYTCIPCMKAAVAAWAKSARGKAKAKQAKRRYRLSVKGKAKERAFQQKPEQKEKQATRRRRQRARIGGHEAEMRTMLKAYGLTVEDWARLYNTQDRKCAACFRFMPIDRQLHVDHSHTTGKVRGLLCRGCNTAIGHAADNPATLRAMAAYLEKTA